MHKEDTPNNEAIDYIKQKLLEIKKNMDKAQSSREIEHLFILD